MSNDAAAMPANAPGPLHTSWEAVLLTGGGFACGFGWLWFLALQDFWLPGFLWGGLLSGGGTTLFAAIICTGFPLAGGLLLLFSPAPDDDTAQGDAGKSRFRRFYGALHAAALVLVALGICLPEGRGLALFLPPACLAVAGVLLGVHWMTAMLSLPGIRGAAAFCLACGFCLLLALCNEHIPDVYRPWLLLGLIALAWALAFGLARSLAKQELLLRLARQEAAPPKRPRGRPTWKSPYGQEREAPPERLRPLPAAFCALLFLAGGLVQGVFSLDQDHTGGFYLAVSGVVEIALIACGAAAQLLLLYRLAARLETDDTGCAVPEKAYTVAVLLLCGAIALQGLVIVLPLPEIWPAAYLAEGAGVCAVLVLCAPCARGALARNGVLFRRQAFLRAVFVLSCAALLSTAGGFIADLLSALSQAVLGSADAAIPWSGVVILSAVFFLALLLWMRRHEKRLTLVEDQVASRISLLALLTEREGEIADLVMQGLSNKDISSRLFISEETVRFHLKNIYQKSGLGNRSALRSLGKEKRRGKQALDKELCS